MTEETKMLQVDPPVAEAGSTFVGKGEDGPQR